MTVSICIIAFNEEKALPRLLTDVLEQDFPKKQTEVVLINSMSTDSTRHVMEKFAQKYTEYKKVLVLDNPKKKQASGWNVAIRNASEDIIFRIDAHASIPADFVRKNVTCIESGEYVSGGPRPNVAEEETPWQNTLLLAESSMFGSSIAGYRRDKKKSYVKSLFHGAYRREVFEKSGIFDEQLGRTEDNEVHYRIRQNGYKLCFNPEIESFQFTRSSLKKMMKQKYGNGYWVVLTLKACPGCVSVYHFVPLAFVLGIFVTTGLALGGHSLLCKLMWGAYGFLAVMMSIMGVFGKKKDKTQILLPLLFFLLHISYGIGSVVGLLKLPFWKYEKKVEQI